MSYDRIVITGVAINTLIGDMLDLVGNNLLSEKSSIGYWRNFYTSNIYLKIGSHLPEYDIEGKLHTFSNRIPDIVLSSAKMVFKQTKRLQRR